MVVDQQAGGVARGPDEAAGRPASARRSGRGETAETEILAKYPGVLIALRRDDRRVQPRALGVVYHKVGRTPSPILTSGRANIRYHGGLTVILVMQDFDPPITAL